MDAKITLSFDKNVIERAKKYAESQNMSLSRLLEYLLDNITSKKYKGLEDLPISEWVDKVAEGEVVYQRKPRSRKSIKAEYKSRKK
ncbi:MAG: DUF6364 family protein [Bacteroidota bacterium]